jgi:hypothetical protein
MRLLCRQGLGPAVALAVRWQTSIPATVGCAFPEPIHTDNCWAVTFARQQEGLVDSIIYLVGLVVVVMAILSFLGLR